MNLIPWKPIGVAVHAITIGAISGLSMWFVGGHGFLGGLVVFVCIALVDLVVSVAVRKFL